MKKDALALVLALSAVACHAFTLDPGETLKWDNVTLAADEEIVANGGAIVFDSDTVVRNKIRLGGEVQVVVNNGASVRFAKTLFKTDPSGKLLCPCSVRFGSDDFDKSAFLPENSNSAEPELHQKILQKALTFPETNSWYPACGAAQPAARHINGCKSFWLLKNELYKLNFFIPYITFLCCLKEISKQLSHNHWELRHDRNLLCYRFFYQISAHYKTHKLLLEGKSYQQNQR